MSRVFDDPYLQYLSAIQKVSGNLCPGQLLLKRWVFGKRNLIKKTRNRSLATRLPSQPLTKAKSLLKKTFAESITLERGPGYTLHWKENLVVLLLLSQHVASPPPPPPPQPLCLWILPLASGCPSISILTCHYQSNKMSAKEMKKIWYPGFRFMGRFIPDPQSRDKHRTLANVAACHRGPQVDKQACIR